MTRPMFQFSGLEAQLDNAIGKHDRATIDRLLSQDFEFRTPDAQGLTARADWLATQVARGGAAVDGLAVHVHGSLAIASFVVSSPAKGATAGSRSYVVDVWSGKADAWRLLTRYQSPLPLENDTGEDVKPTGRN